MPRVGENWCVEKRGGTIFGTGGIDGGRGASLPGRHVDGCLSEGGNRLPALL
jgi:hypothetical protein